MSPCMHQMDPGSAEAKCAVIAINEHQCKLRQNHVSALVDKLGRIMPKGSPLPPSLPVGYTAAMRLKTDIFASALIRRVFSQGGFAAIERKGAESAGALFIRQRFRDGLETLYGPAPQSFAMDDDTDLGRTFEVRLSRAEAAEVGDLLARELTWDSDLWVVEIETDEIGDLISVSGGD